MNLRRFLRVSRVGQTRPDESDPQKPFLNKNHIFPYNSANMEQNWEDINCLK